MPSGSAASRGDCQRVNIGCDAGKRAGRSRVPSPVTGASQTGEEARNRRRLPSEKMLLCETTPLLSLPRNCSGAARRLLRIIRGGGKGVKCCSETRVLQPARQARATFPSQNKTIFAVGSVATKALRCLSLSPPPPPLATDGEDVMPIAEGLQDGRDAGGRCSISSLPEPRFCTSITPWRLIGGDLASCAREGGEMPSP